MPLTMEGMTIRWAALYVGGRHSPLRSASWLTAAPMPHAYNNSSTILIVSIAAVTLSEALGFSKHNTVLTVLSLKFFAFLNLLMSIDSTLHNVIIQQLRWDGGPGGSTIPWIGHLQLALDMSCVFWVAYPVAKEMYLSGLAGHLLATQCWGTK